MGVLELGAFELGEMVSVGGMGTVYAGRHTQTGRPVAVKILAGDRARDPIFMESFRHEVRSVASLDHPRIITLYDFGLVTDEAATVRREFAPGAPWIAMEFAEFGSLRSLDQITDWRDLQSVLFDILDALAHAHARGIVHRDLKPGNVLLVPEDGLLRCKISDFGIAHARGGAAGTHEVFASAAGTPVYMAPEQVESRWRNYGPWTDLYGLGALAYSLVCGRAPFQGVSAVEVARKQLYERPAALDPQLAIPDGLEQWIFRLLEKEPRHRFQRAADALWALQKISPDNPSGMRVPLSRPPTLTDPGDDTVPSPAPTAGIDTGLTTLTFARGFDFDEFPSLEEMSSPTSTALSMPPVPDDWRVRRNKASAVLTGSGLGLFGLREIPFVDRVEECDLVWSALRHVTRRRVAQGIVFQGPGGVGKSRLTNSMARRAHEVGAAKVLVARHGPMSGGYDGIRGMLDSYTGCMGLDIERTYERLRHQLLSDAVDPPELVRYRAAALARFLRPGAKSARVPPVRITGPDELFTVLVGVLERYSRNRSVVVVLRDVQWSLAAVELAERVLANQDEHPSPLLLLVTVRDDLHDDDPLAREAIDRLCRRGNVVRRQLGPLTDRAINELIDGIVGLEPSLRDRIAKASAGNPLYCLQLIGKWVEEGRLIASPQGYQLSGEPDLPDNAYDLWLNRLRNAADEIGGVSTLRAMEVAAAIGMEVDPILWRDACGELGFAVPSGLADLLTERGLAKRAPHTWEFAHELLREALVDLARREGRTASHHAALAAALDHVEGVDVMARRARHLSRADAPGAALVAMLEVAEALVEQALYSQAPRYLSDTEDLLAAAGLPPSAPERGRLLAARGKVLEARGDLDGAGAAFDELRRMAAQHGWIELEIEALRGDYSIHQNRSEVSEAIDKLWRALQLARDADLADSQVRVARSLGWMYQRTGDTKRAFELVSESLRLASSDDRIEAREVAFSKAALAEIVRTEGRVDEARKLVTEAVEQMRDLGDRVGLGDTLNVLAELERRSGNLQRAETSYRDAIENFDLAGHVSGDLVRANLAMLYLDRNRPFEARELLTRAAASFERFNMNYYLAFTRFGLAQTCAVIGDESAWDELIEGFDMLEEVYFEQEFIEIALAASRCWSDRDDAERAAQAAELADRARAGSIDERPKP